MTFKDVLSWIRYLLFRNPFTSVPKDVRFTWVLLWAITLSAFIFAVYNALPEIYKSSEGFFPNGADGALIRSIIGIIGGFGLVALGGFITKSLVSHFGDVIRYVRPNPPNIAARQTIREEGVRLLESILSLEYSGQKKYDRVIVVAHSLGTIVAYDILTHAFARLNTNYKSKDEAGNYIPSTTEPERAKLEEMIRGNNYSVKEYQDQQKKALKELNAQGNPWCVTDFITLGSPLTHSEFLLEKNMQAIMKAQKMRVFPTCPPIMEYDGKTEKMRFSYTGHPKDEDSPHNRYVDSLTGSAKQKSELKKADEAPRYPHHAAPFAYTRWSNLYSPSKFTLWGDQVSGPLANTFGKGIRDIQVMPGIDAAGKKLPGEKSTFLAHTKYWSMKKKSKNPPASTPPPYAVKVLRQVLNLQKG